MKILCTYCSASKDPDKGLIPAFKRYISPRIIFVQEVAEKQDIHFCILSGKFGLVDWNQPLPWYDHLLLREEVPGLVEIVKNQLTSKNIHEVNYYTRDPKFDINLLPYINTIEKASQTIGVEMQIFTLDEPRISATIRNWKLIMEMAAEARQKMIINRAEGEAEIQKLLSKFPDDGMIYFQKASGHEALNEFSKAKELYEIAKGLFPLDRWQWEAQEAINRIDKHLFSGTITEAIERINKLDHIDDEIIKKAIIAIDKTDKQPASTGIELRQLLEMIIKRIFRERRLEVYNLDRNIEVIKIHEIAPNIVINHMHTVRIIGNRAAHPNSGESALQTTDIYPSIYALLAILDWMNTISR